MVGRGGDGECLLLRRCHATADRGAAQPAVHVPSSQEVDRNSVISLAEMGARGTRAIERCGADPRTSSALNACPPCASDRSENSAHGGLGFVFADLSGGGPEVGALARSFRRVGVEDHNSQLWPHLEIAGVPRVTGWMLAVFRPPRSCRSLAGPRLVLSGRRIEPVGLMMWPRTASAAHRGRPRPQVLFRRAAVFAQRHQL